jgi:hypothetical protein
MLGHLTSEDHSEIVGVINRSVPIVIRRCQLQTCPVCSERFRLKFSLRVHMKKVHRMKNFVLPGFIKIAANFNYY